MSAYDQYCIIYLRTDTVHTSIIHELAILLNGSVDDYTIHTKNLDLDVLGNRDLGDPGYFGGFDVNIEFDWDRDKVADDQIIEMLRKIIVYVKTISTKICVLSKFDEFDIIE